VPGPPPLTPPLQGGENGDPQPLRKGGKRRNEIGMKAQLVQDQLFTSPGLPWTAEVVIQGLSPAERRTIGLSARPDGGQGGIAPAADRGNVYGLESAKPDLQSTFKKPGGDPAAG
jgi:hypothetical protein